MLSNYTPKVPVPAESSARYREGWLYADWYSSHGGSADADSPDGWPEEKYEGWWDRLALETRAATTV
ncbi:hypothetical protein [Duganella vulcania]|uniref:Uncharacterized protein n=1 Tax=Duganella vulcania TaxID=2692166 RepID=A0A845GHL7_9BURK|nr:hypothetical protein [Duganella vulcania]MYM92528.1 hypothetical protein [Duganella vulcania]